MRRSELLVIVSATFLANGMYPIVATVFGFILMAWAFWEAKHDN